MKYKDYFGFEDLIISDMNFWDTLYFQFGALWTMIDPNISLIISILAQSPPAQDDTRGHYNPDVRMLKIIIFSSHLNPLLIPRKIETKKIGSSISKILPLSSSCPPPFTYISQLPMRSTLTAGTSLVIDILSLIETRAYIFVTCGP